MAYRKFNTRTRGRSVVGRTKSGWVNRVSSRGKKYQAKYSDGTFSGKLRRGAGIAIRFMSRGQMVSKHYRVKRAKRRKY